MYFYLLFSEKEIWNNILRIYYLEKLYFKSFFLHLNSKNKIFIYFKRI
jgi:hypothetical protein